MSFAELMNNPAFSAFRTRDDVGEQLRMVLSRYHVEPLSRWSELLELTDAVFSGMLEVKDMPELLAQAFGLDERNAWRMARDLIAVQLLPMRDVVPGLSEQIDTWRAAHSEKADVPRTYEDYAEALGARVGFSLSGQHTRRLASHLAAYMNGAKTKEQTSTFVQRPIVIGGLGLTPDQTAILLQFVDEDKGKVQLVDDSVAAEQHEVPRDARDDKKIDQDDNKKEAPKNTAVIPNPPSVIPTPGGTSSEEQNLPEIAPSHELATETPIAAKPPSAVIPTKVGIQSPRMDPRLRGDDKIKGEDDQNRKDAKEIAAHEKKISRIATPPDDARMKGAIDAAVNAASPTLARFRVAKKKFAEIARMAIKGVRDPYQTRGIIERDLGVTGEAVLELIEAVMLGMETYNGAKPAPSAPLPPPPPPPIDESAVLDKRFAVVAGTMPKAPVAPVMPEARVSAARSKEEELAEQSAKVAPAKLEAAAASAKPEQAKAMLTVGSVPPLPPGEMPVVTDVQFKPRLVGPVEELGTMSPADFRRLSSNADEAARKVLDLLHALESTSYEDRIRGVQAWRQSPVNTLYTHMNAEALNNGVALAEVASRRRNKGDESLSPAELRAVANVNAAIRF